MKSTALKMKFHSVRAALILFACLAAPVWIAQPSMAAPAQLLVSPDKQLTCVSAEGIHDGNAITTITITQANGALRNKATLGGKNNEEETVCAKAWSPDSKFMAFSTRQKTGQQIITTIYDVCFYSANSNKFISLRHFLKNESFASGNFTFKAPSLVTAQMKSGDDDGENGAVKRREKTFNLAALSDETAVLSPDKKTRIIITEHDACLNSKNNGSDLRVESGEKTIFSRQAMGAPRHWFWTPDSAYFVISFATINGHSAWHAYVYVYSRKDNRLREIEDGGLLIGESKTKQEADFIPPDKIAVYAMNRGLENPPTVKIIRLSDLALCSKQPAKAAPEDKKTEEQ